MSILIVVAAGVLHALSLAWPFAWGPASGQALPWLQLLAMGLLLWRLERAAGVRQAALLGWCFGTSSLAATFWWLFISMHTYGGLPVLLAVLAVLALAFGLAWVHAAGAAAYVAFKPAQAWKAALLFGAIWTLVELERGTWLTGFPWGAGGYSHIDGWLAGYFPWVGVYGVGGIASWWVASTWQLRRSGWGQRAAWVLVAALPLSGLLNVSVTLGPALDVTLLQGNIPQDEKFQPGTGVADSLAWYGAQLRQAQTTLVVAPETAIPVLPQELPEHYWDELQQVWAKEGGQRAALLGIPLGNSSVGYTNSVLGFKPGASAAYRYDKQHLVPFGEFIPPLFRWFVQLMHIPLGDFNAGDLPQPSFAWQGQRIAPNICYEDLFGEELAASFADPAQAPTILVNVSNLGWFGDSVAIDQHLNIARTRSLEFARPTLRATNTGATVIIDHLGRVQQALPRLTRGALVGQVRGVGLDASHGGDLTPYARWVSALGLWPLGLLALALAALMARPTHRAPEPAVPLPQTPGKSAKP